MTAPTPDSGPGRAWQLVLSHIESRLLDGTLGPGDHLPPERSLAADLGVGRSSVREAVRVLEVLGLIRTQTGSGPSSGAIVIARPGGGMSQLLRLQVAATGFRVSDIVATRLVLETAVAAGLAAMDQPDLTRTHELLAAMDKDLSPQEFLALDAAFHLAMADAAGNEVITAMMAGLRDSIESYVLAGVATVPSWSRTVARLRKEHRGIVDAIRSGEAAEASDRIRTHISGYYAETAVTAPPAATATIATATRSTTGPPAPSAPPPPPPSTATATTPTSPTTPTTKPKRDD